MPIAGDLDSNMRLVIGVLLFAGFVSGGALSGERQKRDDLRCYQVNEVYTDCGPSCPKTCDSLLRTNEDVYCPALCVPGCFCQEGYVRNRWGNCIPLEQCPCHGQNEEYSCGSACDVSCDTLDQKCMILTYKCVQICRCRDGFARDNSATCISIFNCPGYKP